MKRVLLTLLAAISLLTASVGVLSPAYVAAATNKEKICEGVGSVDKSVGCTGGPSLSKIIQNIINIFSIIIGLVAVIMIMIAGFKYITSGGDSGNVTSAKNTLVYAVVGLVVAALAQFIVKFVLEKTN